MRGLLRDLDAQGGGRWSYLIGTESMFAGAGAGLVSSVLTCPLDVVKTKLQAQGGPGRAGTTSYRGLFGSFGTIWTEEGIRGLYRGLGPTLFGYLPTWGIYFTVYDAAKPRFAASRSNAGHGGGNDDVVAHICAAVTAGATSTIATNPLWVIKTRFMTQRVVGAGSEEVYRHTLHAFRRIYSEEGLRGFYRGLVPSLLGVSHVVIQFPVYERIKLYFRPPDGSDLPSSRILIASAASKMLASVITYPHEVIRTRLQISRGHGTPHHTSAAYADHANGSSSRGQEWERSSRAGVISTAKYIARNDGVAGFYRGMGVNLVRTVPNSALTILTYELLMRNLTQLTGSASKAPRD